MSNGAVTGQVLDENGAAQAGLIVGAYDTDGLFGDRLLANTANSSDPLFADYARTAADGSFSVSYAPGTYNLSLAMGDDGYESCWVQCQIQFLDGSTVLATVTKGLTNLGYFYDARGNNWSAASWPGSNVSQTVTLAGSRLLG